MARARNQLKASLLFMQDSNQRECMAGWRLLNTDLDNRNSLGQGLHCAREGRDASPHCASVCLRPCCELFVDRADVCVYVSFFE